MQNKSKQKTSVLRFLWLLPLAALLFLVLTAAYYTYQYQRRFLPGTQIMGVDCSNMTADEAVTAMRHAAGRVDIVLGDSSGTQVANIPLSAFFRESVLTDTVQDVFDRQHEAAGALDWLLTREHVYRPTPLAQVSSGRVAAALEGVLYGASARVAPTDARVELTEGGYTVVSETEGNMVNMSACSQALAEALKTVDSLAEDPPAVIADNALVLPAVTADSEAVTHLTGELDSYLQLPVILEFGAGTDYVLTEEDIRSVSDITLDGPEAVCVPDPERVSALVNDLADRYAYDGVYAKFLHAQDTRPYVYYRVGDTGWKLDRDDLVQQVLTALENRQTAVISPRYDYTWYWKEQYKHYRVGDTYIEISLDNQYLWAFKDGELLVETPVVTGNIARRDYTRAGCFRITYRETDLNLRGPTWDDHVDYWMPFDGEIGLHDSSWRDEYGGDIYLTDGSHGCVNTPLDAMRIIFNNFRSGDVVIVY